MRSVAAGSLALGVLLSGCSALQVRTEDKDSGPVRVAVKENAGGDPTPSGDPTEAGVPEGMSKTSLNLGAKCPVDLSFALADDWTESSSNDEFRVFSRGDSIGENDTILVSCSDAFDDDAESVVEAKRDYGFSEKGSQVLAEKMGTLGAGAYWSFQGLLGPDEIYALNRQPTVMYGVQSGYKINGRLVNIFIEMRSLESKPEAAEEFKQMLPTVAIGGEQVPAPTFK